MKMTRSVRSKRNKIRKTHQDLTRPSFDNKLRFKHCLGFLFLLAAIGCKQPETPIEKVEAPSESINLKENRASLDLKPDSQGNIVPDFSYVGYKAGDEAIPTVAIAATVNPGPGDDQANIQNAIDQVSQLPLVNGYRGGVLLKKGRYEVSGSINITASGVVLRGEGSSENGTVIVATGTSKRNLIEIRGVGEPRVADNSPKVDIVDNYVPFGTRALNVSSAQTFAVGDRVIVEWENNQKWLNTLGMKKFWPKPFKIAYERMITNICGNNIVIDAPLVQAIDKKYARATLYKYSYPGRISHVGVQNLLLISEYKGQTDENHASSAIVVDKAEHGWVSDIEARHFWYSAVYLQDNASHFTVEKSKNIDPISVIDGGRRYSFNNNGSHNLFQFNYTRNGRHDYVTGGRVAGPNVFYSSVAEKTHSDTGPHHHWATGILFDNIRAGEINVQDRGDMGKVGHGWSGAQIVFWNNKGGSMICEKPPTAQNFSFGFIGKRKQGEFGSSRQSCNWQSQGRPMPVKSLYRYQLNARKQAESGPDKGKNSIYKCSAI